MKLRNIAVVIAALSAGSAFAFQPVQVIRPLPVRPPVNFFCLYWANQIRLHGEDVMPERLEKLYNKQCKKHERDDDERGDRDGRRHGGDE